MGMYTELHYNVELAKDVPERVVEVLKYMVGDTEQEPELLPKHELFAEGTRWRFMLRTDSYYFDADTHSTLRYDDIGERYYLCIRCNLKNYDSEIEKFIDWIDPYLGEYIEKGDFLGFYRYEEDNEPTHIYRAKEWVSDLANTSPDTNSSSSNPPQEGDTT